MTIAWCGIGQHVIHLLPDPLHRVELWRAGGEYHHLQPGMLRDESLNLLALVNGMLIPDQDQRAGEPGQQDLQKRDHFLASQRAPVSSGDQRDSTAAGCHAQGTQQIEPLVMRQTGADGGCVPATRPGSFERRKQRKSALIQHDQPCAKSPTLFLSAAKRSAANGRRHPRHARWTGAEPVDYSTPHAASGATRRWGDSALQRVARSTGPSAPKSRNPRCSHERVPHVPVRVPSAPLVWPSIVPVSQADAGVCVASAACASGAPFGASHRPLPRPPAPRSPSLRAAVRADGERPTVPRCLSFAWRRLSHNREHSFFKSQ